MIGEDEDDAKWFHAKIFQGLTEATWSWYTAREHLVLAASLPLLVLLFSQMLFAGSCLGLIGIFFFCWWWTSIQFIVIFVLFFLFCKNLNFAVIVKTSKLFVFIMFGNDRHAFFCWWYTSIQFTLIFRLFVLFFFLN